MHIRGMLAIELENWTPLSISSTPVARMTCRGPARLDMPGPHAAQ
jgi:hypothetical protein